MPTKIKFLKKPKLKDAVLFTGLPGIGLVGKIVVDYLLTEFKAEKIAEISSDSFPPSVHTKKGIIEIIKDEVNFLHHNNQDFLFISGPMQPSLDLRAGTMQEHYEFSSKIVEEIKDIGVKEICTLAGINVGEKRMLAQPRVIVAATDQKILDSWLKLGAVCDKPEGLISGAAGLVLGMAADYGIQGACLMGETNARLIYGDHGAAKKLLEIIAKKYNFEIDMRGMEKEAKKIEQAFKELSKQFREEQDDQPKEGLSYVR